MKRIIYLLLTLLIFKSSFSQTYIPIDSLSAEGKALKIKEYNDKGKKFVESLAELSSGQERKFIKKRFEDLHQEFEEDLKSGQYVFDKSFDAKTNEIVKALRASNSLIPNDLSFYISKSNSANAFSTGDKNFIINMGSFYYFENEDQMAAVIAHEIAHLLLQHSLKAIRQKYAVQKTSAKKELKAIKSSRERKGGNALRFLKQLLEDESKRSRQAEYEADSLGYLLFKKTNYQKAEFVNALQLLAEYDTLQPKGLNIDTYKKVFHLPNQPFKEEWLQRESFSAYDYTQYQAKINADSIKTHPEMAKRISRLRKIYPELQKSEPTIKPGKDYEELSKTAGMEQLPNLNFGEQYGVAIYVCLHHLERDDDADYYKKWLGVFFWKIYKARKEYTANRYLDRVEPATQSESYQQFISFMWNINPTEIKAIADFYSK